MKMKIQYSYLLFLCPLFLLSGSCSALIRPMLYNATPFTTDVVVSFKSMANANKPLKYHLLPGSSTVIERPTYKDWYGEPGNDPIVSIKATVPAIRQAIWEGGKVGSNGSIPIIKIIRHEKTVERTDLEPSSGGNFERAYLDSIDKPGNFAVISTGRVIKRGGNEEHIADLRIHRFIQ